MSKDTKEHVWAVIRVEPEITNPEWHITVTKILRSQAAAERKVARLNALNESKGCRYFRQVTRLIHSQAEVGGG
jgi:hypothetical protein